MVRKRSENIEGKGGVRPQKEPPNKAVRCRLGEQGHLLESWVNPAKRDARA